MTLLLNVGLSFLVFGLAIAAMSIGVIAGRRPIRGSCGGLSGDGCSLCGRRCRRRNGPDTGGAS